MVALVALIFQGNEQILATDSVPLLVSALETIGNNETWDVFVFSHSFRHVDRPIVPNVRLNLNIISQSDCRDHYRFDQDELRQIIPLLPFPEYIITPAGDKTHMIERGVLSCSSKNGESRQDEGLCQGLWKNRRLSLLNIDLYDTFNIAESWKVYIVVSCDSRTVGTIQGAMQSEGKAFHTIFQWLLS